MNKCVPIVSVLMPVYNVGKYIGVAINSILQQTYTDFEFVIVNDGSTDDTFEVISTFNDPRIFVINHNENKGIAAAQCDNT
ncbi:MAG: glycosyltransferase [Parafilimonas sp.]